MIIFNAAHADETTDFEVLMLLDNNDIFNFQMSVWTFWFAECTDNTLQNKLTLLFCKSSIYLID